MRVVLVVVLLGMGLPGCLDRAGVAEGAEGADPITFSKARDLLRSEMGTGIVVSRAAAGHELDLTPDGRSQSWLLETVDGAASTTFEVSARGDIKETDPIPDGLTIGDAPDYAPCEVSGDSSDIARYLVRSEAWGVLDLLNATPDSISSGVQLYWDAECLGGHTSWKLDSSLVQNQDGTSSSRAFWFDERGLLAGFFGDPARGHPMSAASPAPDGINIEFSWAFAESSALGGGTATLTTRNAVQLAIIAEVHFRGIIRDPLATGRLVATGPSGSEYSASWAQDGSSALYIPEATPADARGNWTVFIDLDSPGAPLFDVQFEVCSGVVFQSAEVSCQALFNSQSAE